MDFKCDISEKQNSDHALKYIAAWSYFYQRAKIFAGLQFWLAVPGALAMSLIAIQYPKTQLVTAPIAVLFGWLDILLFDRLQDKQKKLGSMTQELFDCEVLGLESNDLRCAPKPETEIINEAADNFKTKCDTSKHRDWYPSEVRKLPLPLARLICQRAAVWWDMSQRRIYGRCLLGITVILILGVFGYSFAADQKVKDMILSVYIPLAPAVVWSVREFLRQKDASLSLETLKTNVETLWRDALSGNFDEKLLTSKSRQVQDLIFDGRVRNPLFFNVLYRWLREKNQFRMNEKAKEMVEEALGKAFLWEGRIK